MKKLTLIVLFYLVVAFNCNSQINVLLTKEQNQKIYENFREQHISSFITTCSYLKEDKMTVSSHTITILDSLGNEIYELGYPFGTKLTYILKSTYSNSHQLVKSSRFFLNNFMNGSEYKYDEKGELTAIIGYDNEKNISSRAVFKRDVANKLIKVESLSKDGQLSFYSKHTPDNNNYPKTDESCTPEGRVDGITQYYYSPEGILLKTVFKNNVLKEETLTKYYYDSNNLLISKEEYSGKKLFSVETYVYLKSDEINKFKYEFEIPDFKNFELND